MYRVLLTATHAAYGGVSRYVIELAKFLSNMEYLNHILLLDQEIYHYLKK